MAIKLNNLRAAKGARRPRKRVGLGEGSGHGKTSCRGGKGQSARKSGHVRFGFEGGQMPLVRRIPKYGFRSQGQITGANRFAVINLASLERFDNGSIVDQASLKELGLKVGSKERAGIKILGKGSLTKKLTLKVNAISDAARKAVEAAGGSVELI